MKSRSSNDKASRSQSIADNVGRSGKQSQASYQINDRRSASIMQRKFRNLANGLASANIMDKQPQQKKPAFEARPSAFVTQNKDQD